MTFIPLEVVVRSTGSIDKLVEEELDIPDPSPTLAKAIVHENTQKHDRGGSSNDN